MNSLFDVVKARYPGFVKSDDTKFYTFRYVFAQKDGDDVKHCFTHITAPWADHQAKYSALLADDTIESCILEYLGEFDTYFAGSVFVLKSKKDGE